MAAKRIPTWKERLKACFQWRHRLMHVFGVPAAVGAAGAVVASGALNPDTGMAVGALVAGVGTLLAGWYVTAGYDRKLVAQLQAEEARESSEAEEQDIQTTVWNADPHIRPLLERILHTHASIEHVFNDGIDDPVERILQGSRGDLKALRDRAIKMVKLHKRLAEIIRQSDGRRLWDEMNRLKAQVERSKDGPSRKARQEAFNSAERTYKQWQAAVDKQNQIQSVLTVIDKNLEEFKLAMALRKADAIDTDEGAPNVSELQARLTAAGEACDELVGRLTPDTRRSRRVRA